MAVVSSEDIVSITQNILSTMLQLDATSFGSTDHASKSDRVTGCVQISGEWRGAVVIQSSEHLAKTFACRLLQMTDDELSHADMLDAFAEMTNMIGGNIKGQVPAPSSLSIPSVTTGHDFEFHLAGASIVQEVDMECEGEAFRVLLCEENANPASRVSDRKLESTAG